MSEAADRVVVITGASSGMGLAVARLLARQGAKLALAARRESVIEHVARECRALGGDAMAVRADVTDATAVSDLATRAVERFGRLDAWIHTAAVAAFGKVDETPPHVLRKLVETDLVGSMFVTRAALSTFKRQGEGTLVLVASALGKAPIPFLGAYNAAKFGVVGWAETARQELADDGLDERIRVVTVLPPATDTPFYVHAANFVGKIPRPPPPVYGVDTLAEAIVEALDAGHAEVTVGAAGKFMRASHAAAPGLYDSIVGPYAETMFLDEPARETDGNVFEPMWEGRSEDAGWKEGGEEGLITAREGRP